MSTFDVLFRNIFSQVSQENVVDIASLVTDLRDDLMELNFIVVFSASRVRHCVIVYNSVVWASPGLSLSLTHSLSLSLPHSLSLSLPPSLTPSLSLSLLFSFFLQLSFDDFAKYGGLYGDSSDAPLTPLKVFHVTCDVHVHVHDGHVCM